MSVDDVAGDSVDSDDIDICAYTEGGSDVGRADGVFRFSDGLGSG